MPNFAVFEGQVGNVSLTTQFTSGTNIDENLNIEYYSLAKESMGNEHSKKSMEGLVFSTGLRYMEENWSIFTYINNYF